MFVQVTDCLFVVMLLMHSGARTNMARCVVTVCTSASRPGALCVLPLGLTYTKLMYIHKGGVTIYVKYSISFSLSLSLSLSLSHTHTHTLSLSLSLSLPLSLSPPPLSLSLSFSFPFPHPLYYTIGVPNDVQWRCDKLKKLDLSHNRLRALPDSFHDLRRMVTLNISYNNLKELPQSCSWGCVNLVSE